jgi:hypothetical protein
VVVAAGGLGPDLLPPPQADEVVTALGQEAQVAVVVEALGLVGGVRARPHAVVEVVPDVGTGQVDGAAGVVA